MDIEGGKVVERTLALVLVLDAEKSRPSRGEARVATTADLDRGLLVGRDDELVVFELTSVEDPLVEIQHDPGFLGEVRVPRKDQDL